MKSKLGLNLLKLIKMFSLFFSATYLLVWCLQFVSDEMRDKLSAIFMTDMSLPGILDKTTFSTVVDISGVEGTMAYIHAAIVAVALMYICSGIIKKTEEEIADKIEEG